MGCAPFDSKFCVVRRALFESFAPIERGLALLRRHSIRTRAAVLRGDPVPEQAGVRPLGFEVVSSLSKLGASATELGGLLRSYVGDIPQSVVRVIATRAGLVGQSGTLELLGVIAGMVFATVTRASFMARFKWFQSLDLGSASGMLQGLAPCSQEDKSVEEARPGFDDLAQKEKLDD